MRYVAIDPIHKIVKAIDIDDFGYALEKAGLQRNHVDHAQVSHGVAIVVHEFSLFVPPGEQRYFTISGQLFGGKALLYGFDDSGETVDLLRIPTVKFFDSVKAVEDAIAAATIRRPRIIINDNVTWSWPDPPPPEFSDDT